MVSPVRVRVPPLLFSRHFQEKLFALFARLHVDRCFDHSFYHNGRSFEMLREEVAQPHSGLAVHGGGDVGVGVGGLLHRGVSQHLRDQLQLLLVLEHERGEGVPEIVEPDVRQTGTPQKRFVEKEMTISIVQRDGSVARFPREALVTAFLANMDALRARAEGEELPEPHPLHVALKNAAVRETWHDTFFDMFEDTGPVDDLSEP